MGSSTTKSVFILRIETTSYAAFETIHEVFTDEKTCNARRESVSLERNVKTDLFTIPACQHVAFKSKRHRSPRWTVVEETWFVPKTLDDFHKADRLWDAATLAITYKGQTADEQNKRTEKVKRLNRYRDNKKKFGEWPIDYSVCTGNWRECGWYEKIGQFCGLCRQGYDAMIWREIHILHR